MKTVYLFALVVLFSAQAVAQASVAPKLGVNFSTINYGEDLNERFDDLDKPLHAGLSGGLGFDFGVSPGFSIYMEILYTQKGSKYEGSGVENDPIIGNVNIKEETDITLDYLELPLLARLKFGDVTQFYLNVGPTAGYWLGGNVKNEYTLNGETESLEGSIKFKDESEITGNESDYIISNEDVNRLELGAAIGGGFLFSLNSGKFNLDLRYTIGLTSVFEDNSDPDNSWKNNVLAVSIGYFFGMADNQERMGYRNGTRRGY